MTVRKSALVTGAGRGIGAGIALKLAEAGYDVGVHYGTSKEGAEQIAGQIRESGGEAIVLQADLRQVAEARAMADRFVDQFGHIDLLVNNAGITRFTHLLEMEENTFDDIFQTDVKGLYFCTQQAARHMVRLGIRGVVVHISSNHAMGCWPNASVYASAKACVNKLTMNMALDLASHGIRVVGIAPGYTHQGLHPPKPSEIDNSVASRIPMGRLCSPFEIGDAVVYLSSENASYVTGTTLYMDGGALLPVVAQNEYV
jgi:NAD(P)-dependent dehydrogenase (short-subunit alcohol dehydrogenase family)